MEVGEGVRLYAYHYTATTRITPALRWAAIRAILISDCKGQSHNLRQCPQTTTFLKKRGEPKRNRTEVLVLTSLTPYRQAKPAHPDGVQRVTLSWTGLERGVREVSPPRRNVARTIRSTFVAKNQYSSTRNVLGCQAHSSHIHTNHETSLNNKITTANIE